MKCESVDSCGFFRKYHETRDLICQVFIESHCYGDKANLCKRKRYLEKYGVNPVDDMMPDGKMSFVISN